MYNMDILIFGFKFNVHLLILIGVIYLILVGHLFCGCSNITEIMEGFDTSGNHISSTENNNKKTNLPTQNTPGTTGTSSIISATTTKEGFTGANYDESSNYNLDYNKINTNSWNLPNLSVIFGQPLNSPVKQFLKRTPQQLPLPEGEMLMFANTPFKPSCCPNTYSNSSGCACMTGDQYNYLVLRGGNNVPYSEY